VASYEVRFKASAEQELEALQTRILERIFRRIETLANQLRPAGVKKLKGFRDVWRIRVGDYRVVYSIDDPNERIDILRIAHRREAYD
jgi:mRNA interferase RelE/StbE